MANQTIFEFSDKASLVDTDVMLLQEDSNGTTYKVTIANLRSSLLNSSSDILIQNTGSGDVVIGADPGGSDKLRVTGSARFVNSGSVIVGIGSTNGSGGSANHAQLVLDGTANGDFAGSDYAFIRHGFDSTKLEIANLSGDIQIEPTSSVIVGTTDPGGSELLRVGGAGRFKDGLYISDSEDPLEWLSGNGVIEAPGHLYIRSNSSGNIYLQSGGNGDVIIGPTTPTGGDYALKLTRGIYQYRTVSSGSGSLDGIYSACETAATSNATMYNKAIYGQCTTWDISSGVTDSGYKIGVDGSAYSSSTNFEGTLNQAYGVWARAGLNQGGTNAHINTVFGVYAEILAGATGSQSIDNAYAVYATRSSNNVSITNYADLYCATSGADNYIAGNLRVNGTTNTGSNSSSINNGSTSTLFSLTTVGVYFVIISGQSSQVGGSCTVYSSGSALIVTGQSTSSGAFTSSGTNIRWTNSGSSQSFLYSYLRMF